MSDIERLIASTETEIAEAQKRLELLKALRAKEKDNAWVTAKEAAEQMGISVRTIPVWCADGKLEGKRPGKKWLVSQASIDRFLGGFCSE